ncbi:MAG TPA: hypothetical protein VNL96_06855 [Gemmatimonadaceae bacterium]|nr:hypothetical protein [Gemmatimonadaceae bacterium]
MPGSSGVWLASLGRKLVFAATALGLVVALAWTYSAVKALVTDGGSSGVLAAGLGPEPDPPYRTSTARDLALVLPDTLLGRSGALRFATLTPVQAAALPGFLDAFGESALRRPGVLQLEHDGSVFSLVMLRPFGHKRGEYLNGYRLGRWPAERWLVGRGYFNPDGFVEVTPANAQLAVSEHFRLGDFLMKDGQAVWPKYLLLDPRLVDKLELVLRELGADTSVVARGMVVLSGFRAPYYNDYYVSEGAARASRHQYGDAADIVVDFDGDGRMDDLDRNGRVDLEDMRPVIDAVLRVERRYPELVGGLGTYAAMGPSGPFAHVDVRGTRARWSR